MAHNKFYKGTPPSWTSVMDNRDDLPDAAFAWIHSEDGERERDYPHHFVSGGVMYVHPSGLGAAASRAVQHDPPESAKNHISAAQKWLKGMRAKVKNDIPHVTLALTFAAIPEDELQELRDADKNPDGTYKRLQLVRDGAWDHPWYGPMAFTTEHFNQMVEHFKGGVKSEGVPLLRGHPGLFSSDTDGAAGWLVRLDNRRDADENATLWGDFRLNSLGREAIEDDRYRYTSVGIFRGDGERPGYPNYETGQEIDGAVLDHVALTNSPFVTGMEPVTASKGAGIFLSMPSFEIDEELTEPEHREEVETVADKKEELEGKEPEPEVKKPDPEVKLEKVDTPSDPTVAALTAQYEDLKGQFDTLVSERTVDKEEIARLNADAVCRNRDDTVAKSDRVFSKAIEDGKMTPEEKASELVVVSALIGADGKLAATFGVDDEKQTYLEVKQSQLDAREPFVRSGEETPGGSVRPSEAEMESNKKVADDTVARITEGRKTQA